jgi:hypothetical protein
MCIAPLLTRWRKKYISTAQLAFEVGCEVLVLSEVTWPVVTSVTWPRRGFHSVRPSATGSWVFPPFFRVFSDMLCSTPRPRSIGELKSEKIWKILKKGKLNCEKIWKTQKKGKLNSDKIWTMWKKIVKWYGNYRRNPSWIVKSFGKYRRKLWNDMENMDEK